MNNKKIMTAKDKELDVLVRYLQELIEKYGNKLDLDKLKKLERPTDEK